MYTLVSITTQLLLLPFRLLLQIAGDTVAAYGSSASSKRYDELEGIEFDDIKPVRNRDEEEEEKEEQVVVVEEEVAEEEEEVVVVVEDSCFGVGCSKCDAVTEGSTDPPPGSSSPKKSRAAVLKRLIAMLYLLEEEEAEVSREWDSVGGDIDYRDYDGDDNEDYNYGDASDQKFFYEAHESGGDFELGARDALVWREQRGDLDRSWDPDLCGSQRRNNDSGSLFSFGLRGNSDGHEFGDGSSLEIGSGSTGGWASFEDTGRSGAPSLKQHSRIAQKRSLEFEVAWLHQILEDEATKTSVELKMLWNAVLDHVKCHATLGLGEGREVERRVEAEVERRFPKQGKLKKLNARGQRGWSGGKLEVILEEEGEEKVGWM